MLNNYIQIGLKYNFYTNKTKIIILIFRIFISYVESFFICFFSLYHENQLHIDNICGYDIQLHQGRSSKSYVYGLAYNTYFLSTSASQIHHILYTIHYMEAINMLSHYHFLRYNFFEQLSSPSLIVISNLIFLYNPTEEV